MVPDVDVSSSRRQDTTGSQDPSRETVGENNLQTPRGKMIVVASLIDKMPNLAGLARTCEVFQATEVRVCAEFS